MDYRLRYTQRALKDLAEIVEYIAEDDEGAASRFGAALLDHIELLKRFPWIGDTVEQDRRVRKLTHSPILAYYRVYEDAGLIVVLYLRHGSRRPPKL
ncbi:MAG TPA: type II toxin-antitoxin system RelE/ParE family toxin [Candidatus Baltobacteraceae bacterium]|nr:type II toxin-antitoxin system RelE/ParE family toxin [Candidatus Baltobacteraceae bacterium]